MTLDPQAARDWTHRGCPWGIRFLVCSTLRGLQTPTFSALRFCLHGPPKTSALCTAPLSLWGLLRVPHGPPSSAVSLSQPQAVPAALPVGHLSPRAWYLLGAQPLLLTAFIMIGVNGEAQSQRQARGQKSWRKAGFRIHSEC